VWGFLCSCCWAGRGVLDVSLHALAVSLSAAPSSSRGPLTVLPTLARASRHQPYTHLSPPLTCSYTVAAHAPCARALSPPPSPAPSSWSANHCRHSLLSPPTRSLPLVVLLASLPLARLMIVAHSGYPSPCVGWVSCPPSAHTPPCSHAPACA
jgi:hypothetical protein